MFLQPYMAMDLYNFQEVTIVCKLDNATHNWEFMSAEETVNINTISLKIVAQKNNGSQLDGLIR